MSNVEIDYLIADHPGQLADTDYSTLSKGETYNMTAPSSIGEYTFSYGYYWDDTMEIDGAIKYTTPSYIVEYKSGATTQKITNYYTKKPKPDPTKTQKFNINYWALRGGEGGTSLGTETVEVSPGETYTVQKKTFLDMSSRGQQ